jgi:pilus assembly protein Flp/PilA
MCYAVPIFDGRRDINMLYMPREEGQGLVEYALILVLVAVVVIVILALLGPIIGNVFSNIVSQL